MLSRPRNWCADRVECAGNLCSGEGDTGHGAVGGYGRFRQRLHREQPELDRACRQGRRVRQPDDRSQPEGRRLLRVGAGPASGSHGALADPGRRAADHRVDEAQHRGGGSGQRTTLRRRRRPGGCCRADAGIGIPDDSWDSSGASAYAGRNSEQVGRVQTMLGLDHMVAGVLATEAGQIAATRDSLDGHADWLGAMSMLTTGTGAVPGFGTAARLATEFAMVAKAVGDSNDDVTTLSARIDQNAAVLQTAAAQYEALAADVTPAEPQAAEPQAPADADSTAAGCPTAGDEVAPGGGGEDPSGGAGSAPAGWSAATPMSSAPASPAGMPGALLPSPDAATGAAGALGGILGSLVSPLSGLLAGFAQAAGQAAQIVTQAATQAAQLAGQAGDPVADTAELDSDRDRDDEGDADEDERESHVEDREQDGEGEPEEGRAGGVPGTDSAGAPADPQAPDARNEPAKTLPPDLEAVASGGAAAGSAPVHVGADFEQGQLHVAAAATLDRGVPGSAAVIDR
ncbi:hypothetical protein LT337_15840 [Mycolicibacterium fortuitum]|nr:hypothetical protein LT337_15840 [Mycolicibacterium fortuitum]